MSQNIDPTRSQFDEFKALPTDSPILMLNLVRLKQHANYDDGTRASGQEAYGQYGQETGPLLERVGGSIVWQGIPELVLIGPGDENWDIAFIVRYPNADAFLQMVTSPEYQTAVVHRRAAVEDSRLLRLGESDAESG